MAMQSAGKKTISNNEENEKTLFKRYCKELAGLVLVIQYKSTWVLKAAKNWLRVHLLPFLIGEDENTLLLLGGAQRYHEHKMW